MPLSLSEFCVLPRFAGVWEGEFICLDADAKEMRRFRSLITQRIVGNQWLQTNENSYPGGTADTWHFFGRTTAPGEMRLESPDTPYRDFRMIVREVADAVILLQVWDGASGCALATETFTLINPGERVRTIQQFAPPDGTLRGFIAVKERRVA
jgi:hypothetical protein